MTWILSVWALWTLKDLLECCVFADFVVICNRGEKMPAKDKFKPSRPAEPWTSTSSEGDDNSSSPSPESSILPDQHCSETTAEVVGVDGEFPHYMADSQVCVVPAYLVRSWLVRMSFGIREFVKCDCFDLICPLSVISNINLVLGHAQSNTGKGRWLVCGDKKTCF